MLAENSDFSAVTLADDPRRRNDPEANLIATFFLTQSHQATKKDALSNSRRFAWFV